MKFSISLAALMGLSVSGHYIVPRASSGSVSSNTNWQFTRRTENQYMKGPVPSLLSEQMNCFELSPGTPAPETLPVVAGGNVVFTIESGISHPGPTNVYMAKAPTTAANFDGKGPVWFKIYEDKAVITSSTISWNSLGQGTVSVPIPKCIANGEYLIRFEHLAMHAAYEADGAQAYISCTQLAVTGGTGTYKPTLMSFPGAYKLDDPGLLFSIYSAPKSYTNPGGRPLQC